MTLHEETMLRKALHALLSNTGDSVGMLTDLLGGRVLRKEVDGRKLWYFQRTITLLGTIQKTDVGEPELLI